MARAKRRKAKRQRLHKEPIVREVARLLETGHPTKWRWTSAARHGLRAAMCLKGTPWDVADKRAEEIVTLARHRIGLSVVPSWTEANGTQHAVTYRTYHFCQGCGGYDSEGHDRPWCSPECRRTVIGQRYDSAQRLDDAARLKATRVILTGGAEDARTRRSERRCRQCEKYFTPARGDQRFCSHRCGIRASRNITMRDCLVCAMPFRPPRVDAALYCSRPCQNVAEARRRKAKRAAAPPNTKPCRVCGQQFRPTAAGKMLCSPKCVEIALATNRASQLAKRKAARQRVLHEVDCRVCGTHFRHINPRAVYCSKACVLAMHRERMRTKKVEADLAAAA